MEESLPVLDCHRRAERDLRAVLQVAHHSLDLPLILINAFKVKVPLPIQLPRSYGFLDLRRVGIEVSLGELVPLPFGQQAQAMVDIVDRPDRLP